MTPQSDPQLLVWTKDAEGLLNEIPAFARETARRAVEDRARETGQNEVTVTLVRETGIRLGMLKLGNQSQYSEIPVAKLVVLKKLKKFAPSFHQHILKAKIQEKIVTKGEKILVYEVEQTDPEGQVRVTENTQLEFK